MPGGKSDTSGDDSPGRSSRCGQLTQVGKGRHGAGAQAAGRQSPAWPPTELDSCLGRKRVNKE